jgi:ankyrin repeat protein
MSIRRLPPQPSLEQLRKQAKDLLHRYTSGDPAAIAEVIQLERHPNPAAFALSAAQRVLARSYGFKSWPAMKAFVDGVNVEALAEAVKHGEIDRVRAMLNARPELIGMDMSGGNEHRALHFAVLRRDSELVRILMEAGADARKGIYPHRDATSAFAIARDRGYDEIVAVIEREETLRRQELSCPNATISPIQDRISAAISDGDTESAIRLLQADGSLIQACDRNGETTLHVAARASNEEMVNWLLRRRASVNKPDMQGRTPLDLAALAINPHIARILIEHGADVTIRGAVALGDASRVRELLQSDPASLHEISPNGGLLTLAVNHGQIEMVRLLLDLGADVDERIHLEELEEPTASWGMPLWHAALANRFEIAKLLLDRGADPNANVYASGWPLRNAWNHEDGLLRKLLLERGAEPQPYMVAEAHDVDRARSLLQADSGEELARELAWSAADHGCPEIIELALANLHWPLNDARWHWILIQPIRGATQDHPNRQGHFDSMAVLLRHGVDPNVSRYGQTPLHFAAGYRGTVSDEDRARFAAMLIEKGARLDVRDDLLRSTPLGWACRWGRTAMVLLLIEKGAPVTELDAEAWAAPRAWAEKTGQRVILELLNGKI